jgi:hypothetical protein
VNSDGFRDRSEATFLKTTGCAVDISVDCLPPGVVGSSDGFGVEEMTMLQERAIFLVEDDDNDADLAARAFQRAKITSPLVRARWGGSPRLSSGG